MTSSGERAAYWRVPGLALEAMGARFEHYAYPMHAHDTYSFGVTDDGAQSFVCRLVRFGGRPSGKGPAQQGPRRSADPTRTLQAEWAYRQVFTSNTHRTAALAPWLNFYNTGRRHTALGGHPPISRLSPTP